MHKSSIHFRSVQSNSEAHNLRTSELDYVHSDMTEHNQSWSTHSVSEMEKEISRYCKATSGRKLQKNAEPIKEAVVNLHEYHSLDDLKALSRHLNEEYGMECFQIHIHRDEGRKNEFGFVEINHHAHMLFRWQDKTTGKTLKINKVDLSKVQDIVAESLGMERGELRVNSNRNRLEAIEYKRQQEQIRLEKLQQQTAELEQKKNILDQIEQAERGTLDQEVFREILNDYSRELSADHIANNFSEENISKFLAKTTELISSVENEIKSIEKS